MAALAVPVIEAVVARVIAALGIGATAGVAAEAAREAREAARQRREEAEQAKASPIARTDAQTKPKDKCKDCPPDKGAPTLQPTAGWKSGTIEYQQRIAQMPPAPSGYLTEWSFNGVGFDGFESSQCLLKEAKAGYDQFFNEWGEVKGFFQGFEKMFEQLQRQAVTAAPRPPTQLRWHFMEPMSYRYFSKTAARAYPDVAVVYQP